MAARAVSEGLLPRLTRELGSHLPQ
jgi:hypothetical protein